MRQLAIPQAQWGASAEASQSIYTVGAREGHCQPAFHFLGNLPQTVLRQPAPPLPFSFRSDPTPSSILFFGCGARCSSAGCITMEARRDSSFLTLPGTLPLDASDFGARPRPAGYLWAPMPPLGRLQPPAPQSVAEDLLTVPQHANDFCLSSSSSLDATDLFLVNFDGSEVGTDVHCALLRPKGVVFIPTKTYVASAAPNPPPCPSCAQTTSSLSSPTSDAGSR